MIRDPFYRQIIERLDGQLDPELFERCVADLLRKIYPTLVPIRGGSDLGMDGAVADSEGEAFPLVSTTGKNVIDNLTRNLKSYLQDKGSRRKTILATSQELTARRRNNLEKRARELGFVLVQIYDQAAVANLLYRSPEWCLELLNLTGDPAPLSVIPLTERPFLLHDLVGRDTDYAQLRQSSGDLLLVGQPGSGKTFLLYKLALEGGGLFVISKDRSQIAAVIRSEQPEVLIVDDAQINRDLLVHLRQIREATGAKYKILASSWPGDQGTIAQTLNLSDVQIHHLDLLTRDEIVEVIKATGVFGPTELVREIVNQAEGRPGLAVTLAHLCLVGGVREVAFGDALSRSILKFFEPVVGQRATAVLAAFSVGGDAGMSMQIVANEMGLSLVDVREIATKLAAGGVIWQVDQHHLSVRPPALRHVLVRDVFFQGALSLPIEQLLRQVPRISDVAHTLLGARSRGAVIPQTLLIQVLEQTHSEDAWFGYVSLGRDEASWTLQHLPEKIISVAQPALYNAPEFTIPLLLKESIGDQRQLHSTPEHPLRLINDWVRAGLPGTGAAFKRRKLLFDSVRSWLSSGSDAEVGLRALQSVFASTYEGHITDPGIGNKITWRFSSLSVDDIHAIEDLWSEAFKVIETIQIQDWEVLRNMIEDWAYPGRINATVSPEVSDAMRSCAGKMLCNVVLLAKDRPGVLHWAAGLAKDLELPIEISLDPDFEILYPEEDHENWIAAHAQQLSAVQELAVAWVNREPTEIVSQINLFEQEAQFASLTWPRWTPVLCQELAERTELPNAWLRAMLDANSTSDLIEPFLRKAAQVNAPDWIELAIRCLAQPTQRTAAISATLTHPTPPEELLTEVLSNLQDYAQLVKTYCVRNEISENVLKQLLRHSDVDIASAAAVGEWLAELKGTVRESLYKDWKDVVVNRIKGAERNIRYWLKEILKDDSSLAFNWLEAFITGQPAMSFKYRDVIKIAANALDSEASRRLMRQIPETYSEEELVNVLVGNNLALYTELLENGRLKDLHLVPLTGVPEGVWVEKAKLALDAGYSVKEVVRAVLPFSFSWSGNQSDMWVEWVARFEKLCSDEDERIQEIGVAGKAYAEHNRDLALKKERNEAIFGRSW